MLMIGVSTGQNITNLIPALQEDLEVDRLWLLETATAKRHAWSEGLVNVLGQRGVPVEKIDLSGFDSHIGRLQELLRERLSNELHPVLWNLGGGQKPQQIAQWETFRYRNEILGIADEVCYANQDDTGLLEIWDYEGSSLRTRQQAIRLNLEASEIFEVFGFQLQGNPVKIFGAGARLPDTEVIDFLNDSSRREFLFRLPVSNEERKHAPLSLQGLKDSLNAERKNISSAIGQLAGNLVASLVIQKKEREFLDNPQGRQAKVDKCLKETKLIARIYERIESHFGGDEMTILPDVGEQEDKPIAIEERTLAEWTGGRFQKAAFYIEHIVVQRISAMLSSRTNHRVTGAYANVNVCRNGEVVAEYDVLCVTKNGTLLALDAKTYEFAKKDIDARLYNLEQGSGYYRQFSAVFPYDPEDLNKPWFKTISKLPFMLQKRRLSFFVLCDSTDSPFWIRKIQGEQIECRFEKPVEGDWILCRPLAQFLD